VLVLARATARGTALLGANHAEQDAEEQQSRACHAMRYTSGSSSGHGLIGDGSPQSGSVAEASGEPRSTSVRLPGEACLLPMHVYNKIFRQGVIQATLLHGLLSRILLGGLYCT